MAASTARKSPADFCSRRLLLQLSGPGSPIDLLTASCEEAKEFSMPSRACLVLGQSSRCEFHVLMSRLKELTAAGTLSCRETADTGQAIRWLEDPEWTAELAVVLQEYPGEFTAATATALLGAAPLCRWICCAGLWCESELRHGSCWPAAIHVPARLAEHRLARELQVLSGKARPLPITGGGDEVFAADSQAGRWQPAEPADSGAVVRVSSPDQSFRAYTAEVLQGAGFTIRQSLPADASCAGPDECLLVLDLDPRGLQNQPAWPAAAIPVLGLMALPTPEDYQQASRSERRRLLPKLVPPAVLRQAARELTGSFSPGC